MAVVIKKKSQIVCLVFLYLLVFESILLFFAKLGNLFPEFIDEGLRIPEPLGYRTVRHEFEMKQVRRIKRSNAATRPFGLHWSIES